MSKITYIEGNGTEHVIDVRDGMSVMEGALQGQVPGILAECGGSCACATCHVYVDPAWTDKTGEMSDTEDDLLAFLESRQATSRLCCQIRVTPELNGLVVRIPPPE